MTAREAIKKFVIELIVIGGQEMLKLNLKPNKAQVEEIKSLKSEIIAELKALAVREAAREAAEKAAKEAERAAIKNDSAAIEVKFHEGEVLSGYVAIGEARDILEEVGAARYIRGWGTLIDEKMVAALGTSFKYSQVLEYLKPAKEAKEAKVQEKLAAVSAKFAEAKATGKKVLLESWTEDCCMGDEDCSMDRHEKWACPDGSVEHTWSHCW